MGTIYWLGAAGMYIALKESKEPFSWWWPIFILCWPVFLVADHVLERSERA